MWGLEIKCMLGCFHPGSRRVGRHVRNWVKDMGSWRTVTPAAFEGPQFDTRNHSCVCVTVHGWQWRWWGCCCWCTSCWCCSAGRWQHWSRASFERRTEGAEATAEKGHGFNQTAGQGNSLIPAPASSLSACPWQERRLRALRAKAGALTVADLQYLLARKLREWDCYYAPNGMLHPKGL